MAESTQDKFLRYLREIHEYDPTFLPRFVESVASDSGGYMQNLYDIEDDVRRILNLSWHMPSVQP